MENETNDKIVNANELSVVDNTSYATKGKESKEAIASNQTPRYVTEVNQKTTLFKYTK